MYPAALVPGAADLASDDALEASCNVRKRVEAREDSAWSGFSPWRHGALSLRRVSERDTSSRRSSGAPGQHPWIQDWRTWLIVVGFLAILGPAVLHFHQDEIESFQERRKSVREISYLHKSSVSNQLKQSVGALFALQSLVKVDDDLVRGRFDELAELLREKFRGISCLQLAPAGIVSNVHPMLMGELNNSVCIGHRLLGDPLTVNSSLQAISKAPRPRLSGPRPLRQGGNGIIVRLALFTDKADQFLPDIAWKLDNGTTLIPRCSSPSMGAAAKCSFPGRARLEGAPQTYFWGFVILISQIEDLIKPVDLGRLSNHSQENMILEYQLKDRNPHPKLTANQGVFAHSPGAGPEVVLEDPEELNISIEELGVSWVLCVCPRDGWPRLSSGFWYRLGYLFCIAFLTLGAATIIIVVNVRGAYKKLGRLEDYRRRKRLAVVEHFVEDIDRVRFPMCLMSLSDFESLDRLIAHEDARSRALLKFVDSLAALEGCRCYTAFVSHQWTGFDQPDHTGLQFSNMVQACKDARSLGHSIKWVWVDYFSIPQQHRDQQQIAIDTLAVYAAQSAIFLAVVPSCRHAVLPDCLVDANSYMGRAWCRLEQLAFLSAHASMDKLPAYLCSGSNGLRPLFDDSTWCLLQKAPNQTDASRHPCQTALEVMDGKFTCCDRLHPSGMQCDRDRIVGVMLGILWRLKASARDRGASAPHACTLLRLIEDDPEPFFPQEFEYKCAHPSSQRELTERRELFGDFVEVLDQLFRCRSPPAEGEAPADSSSSEDDSDSLLEAT